MLLNLQASAPQGSAFTDFDPESIVSSGVNKLPKSAYVLEPYHIRLTAPTTWESRLKKRPCDKNLWFYLKVDATEYHNLVWVAQDNSIYGYKHRNAAGTWLSMSVRVNGANKTYYVNGTPVLTTTKDCVPAFAGSKGFMNVWLDTGNGASGLALPAGYEWY